MAITITIIWMHCNYLLNYSYNESTRQRDWSTAFDDTTTWHCCCRQQLHWLSVPERVNFKLCVLVYCCLHGLGPEYFSVEFRLVSEIHSAPQIQLWCWQCAPYKCLYYHRVRSASSTDVVVPATRRFHLATAHFRSQEHGRGTRYRPVSPPRRPSSFRQLLKTFLFQRQLCQ